MKFSLYDDMPLPVIMVCGPKSSGKSTFSRLTLNNMLNKAALRRKQSKATTKDDGVALLDLDLGQPEFSPPGELSLVHLRTPIFGPPFSHPIVEEQSGNRLVRAHHVAAISPKDDPDHYLACALDLIRHYHRLLQSHPSCPLVINCCGWIFGSGLEVLTELILRFPITDVVYMSDTGPPEVVDDLVIATTRAKKPFHMLPSQPSEYATRSSADLRAMQALSYFHLSKTEGPHLSWNPMPISSMTPWVVRYAGPHPGILGIMILGERQDPEYLAQLLDGTLVGVVAIEDDSAIPQQHQDHIMSGKDPNAPETHRDGSDSLTDSHCAIYQFPKFAESNDDFDMQDLHPPPSPTSSHSTCPFTTDSTHKPHPSITPPPTSSLPYLFSGQGTCTPLDPSKSHSLGLALIRGIDKVPQTLHLLTPIPASTIATWSSRGTRIVLVKGKLDTPSWAYQEDYCRAAGAERAVVDGDGDVNGVVGDVEGEGRASGKVKPKMWEGDVPWVKVLIGAEGRGRGEKVWRVRRDSKFRNGGQGGNRMGMDDVGMSD